MKVAFFNYLPASYGGGLASFYQEIAAGLQKRYPEIKPRIVSFDEKTARVIQSIYSLYFLRNEHIKSAQKITNKTAHTIHDMQKLLTTFDVIYTKNDILELTLLKIMSVLGQLPPVIVGFHTPVYYEKAPTFQAKLHNIMYSSSYYTSLLSMASGFHVLNDFHERKLKEYFPEKPIRKIYNPVNTQLFNKLVTRNPQRGTLKVLWVGRLTKDKGCDDLMKLISTAPARMYWTIIGAGALNKQIVNISKRCNNVTYFPHMNHRTLAKEYSKHDVFLSTSKWECLPYTVLEAQLSGLPVVAYDIPGCSDIIINKKTGILASDFTDLSKKLTDLKLSAFDRNSIRKTITTRFSTRTTYDQLHKFIKQVHEQKLR